MVIDFASLDMHQNMKLVSSTWCIAIQQFDQRVETFEVRYNKDFSDEYPNTNTVYSPNWTNVYRFIGPHLKTLVLRNMDRERMKTFVYMIYKHINAYNLPWMTLEFNGLETLKLLTPHSKRLLDEFIDHDPKETEQGIHTINYVKCVGTCMPIEFAFTDVELLDKLSQVEPNKMINYIRFILVRQTFALNSRSGLFSGLKRFWWIDGQEKDWMLPHATTFNIFWQMPFLEECVFSDRLIVPCIFECCKRLLKLVTFATGIPGLHTIDKNHPIKEMTLIVYSSKDDIKKKIVQTLSGIEKLKKIVVLSRNPAVPINQVLLKQLERDAEKYPYLYGFLARLALDRQDIPAEPYVEKAYAYGHMYMGYKLWKILSDRESDEDGHHLLERATKAGVVKAINYHSNME